MILYNAKPAEEEPGDWMNRYARENHGLPPEWKWFQASSVYIDQKWPPTRQGIMLTGGIPRIITKGPRKGRETWDKRASSQVFIPEQEIRKAVAAERTPNA